MLSFVGKNIIKNHSYTISIILKIALSVMLVFIVIQLGNTALSRFRSYLTSHDPMDFEMRDLTLEQVKRFDKEFPSEGKITAVQSVLGFFDFDSSMTLRAWLWAGEEEGLGTMKHIVVSEGTFPQKDFEIVIEKSANRLLPEPYQIGDKITVQLSSGKYEARPSYTFTVSGFLEDSGLLETSENQVIYAVTSLRTAEIITKNVGLEEAYAIDIVSDANFNHYDIAQINIDLEKARTILYPDYKELMNIFNSGAIKEEQSKQLGKILSSAAFNQEKFDIYNGQEGYSQFNLAMYTVAFFIAAASVMLLFNSMNINFSQQIRQWGSMRTLGLSQKQLTKVLMIEGAIYFISGSALGIVIGSVLTQLTGGRITSALIKSEVSAVLSLSGYIISLLISAMAVAFSIMLICRKSARLAPVEMMNYHEHIMKGEGKVIHKLRFNANNPILLIGIRQIFRRKTAVYTVGIILIISNILFATLANTFFSIEWPESDPKSKIADFEIIQDFLEDFNPQFDSNVLAELKNTVGAKSIYAMGNSLKYVVSNAANNDFVNVRTYNDELFAYFCQSAGITLENIHEPTAFSVGDIRVDDALEINVTLMEDIRDNILYSGTIFVDGHYDIDFFQNGGNIREGDNLMGLVINEAYARQIYGEAYFNDIFFETDMDSAELIEIINPIIERFYDYRYVSFETSLSPDMIQLLAIMVIVLMLSIYIIIILLQLEIGAVKTNLSMYIKEYSIHRALGASLIVIRRIICFEALAVSAIAGIISVFFSLLFNMVITNLIFKATKINILLLIAVPLLNILMYVFIFWKASAQLCRSTISDSIRNNG